MAKPPKTQQPPPRATEPKQSEGIFIVGDRRYPITIIERKGDDEDWPDPLSETKDKH
jgi:hypothetical protein